MPEIEHYILTLNTEEMAMLRETVRAERNRGRGGDRVLHGAENAVRDAVPLTLRPLDELPELGDEDYGAWKNTIDVLGFTESGERFVVYAQVWSDEDDPPVSDEPVRWKLKGRDSYDAEGMVGWMPLPTLGKRPTPRLLGDGRPHLDELERAWGDLNEGITAATQNVSRRGPQWSTMKLAVATVLDYFRSSSGAA